MNEFYLSTEFALVNSKEPINRQIYKFLKKAIIECRLMPDDPLSENEVSSKFKYKISRQPVREALIKLAENDFVIIEPKKTTKVSRISKSDVIQGAIIRRALEGHIIRLAAPKITDADIEKLTKNVEAQSYVAEQYNLHEHFALDDEFHNTILSIAGMQKAWNIVEGVKGVMDRVRFLSLEYELTPMITTSDAHFKILEALKTRDPDLCEKAIVTHIDDTSSSLQGIIQKCKPDWFTD